MEVVDPGSGEGPVSDVSSERSDDNALQRRIRLNIVLYIATVLCAGLLVVLTIAWWSERDDEVNGVPVSLGEGTDVGGGVVTPVGLADKDDQERVGDQLSAARDMVTAFVNIDFEDVEGSLDEVLKRSTGTFFDQYTAASKPLSQLAKQAKAKQEGEVAWTGLVAGDEDSATVIVVADSRVANSATNFEVKASVMRLQLELMLVKGEWLVGDLQVVA